MKIVLATDGSEHSINAALLTRRLFGQSAGTQVLIVHVLPLVRFPGQDDELAQRGQTALDRSAQALDLPEDRVTTRLTIGTPGEALCQTATDEEADLIVMGARGLSAGAAVFLGSTSYRVLQGASCPVLISH